MIFNFVYKWFDPVLSIKNINHVAFWMFLTKTSNVIESFMWTHFDVLLKNLKVETIFVENISIDATGKMGCCDCFTYGSYAFHWVKSYL